jgi:hypothetical protein
MTNLTTTYSGTPAYAAAKYGTGLSSGVIGNIFNTVQTVGTLECWVNSSTSATGINMAVGESDNSTIYGMGLGQNSSGMAMYLGPGGVQRASTTSIRDATWHHLALTTDGTYIKFWVDGVNVRSDAYTGTFDTGWGSGTTAPITAGGYGTGGSYNWNGIVDEIRVSKVLRYTTTFVPQSTAFQSDSNTVALWHLDSNSIDTSSTIPTSSYLVQGTYNQGGTNTNATHTYTLVGTPVTTSTLVVAIAYYNNSSPGSAPTITLSGGGVTTWNQISNFYSSTFTGTGVAIFAGQVTGTTGYTNVQAAFGATGWYSAAYCFEWNNLSTSWDTLQNVKYETASSSTRALPAMTTDRSTVAFYFLTSFNNDAPTGTSGLTSWTTYPNNIQFGAVSVFGASLISSSAGTFSGATVTMPSTENVMITGVSFPQGSGVVISHSRQKYYTGSAWSPSFVRYKNSSGTWVLVTPALR